LSRCRDISEAGTGKEEIPGPPADIQWTNHTISLSHCSRCRWPVCAWSRDQCRFWYCWQV